MVFQKIHNFFEKEKPTELLVNTFILAKYNNNHSERKLENNIFIYLYYQLLTKKSRKAWIYRVPKNH